ncbi:hypothetical protein [Neobacillus sp. NPDC093127]|uniref:hypothetical protein n=1 Tax=Neobacillus sp. NPDC093127 TaxID=3364296 RepID=UPI0037FBFDDB
MAAEEIFHNTRQQATQMVQNRGDLFEWLWHRRFFLNGIRTGDFYVQWQNGHSDIFKFHGQERIGHSDFPA